MRIKSDCGLVNGGRRVPISSLCYVDVDTLRMRNRFEGKSSFESNGKGNNGEDFGQDRVSGEQREGRGGQKHEVFVEPLPKDNQERRTLTDRAVWLEGVMGVKGTVDSAHAQVFNEALDEWKETLRLDRETSGVLGELRRGGEKGRGRTIPFVIVDALRERNWEKITTIQTLGKNVVERYGSGKGRGGWPSLPEKNKRYVRLGEMTVLMGDALKVLRDVESGTITEERLRGMVGMLRRYQESLDIPDSFKQEFLRPLLEGRGQKPARQENRPRREQLIDREQILQKAFETTDPTRHGSQSHESAKAPALVEKPTAARPESQVQHKPHRAGEAARILSFKELKQLEPEQITHEIARRSAEVRAAYADVPAEEREEGIQAIRALNTYDNMMAAVWPQVKLSDEFSADMMRRLGGLSKEEAKYASQLKYRYQLMTDEREPWWAELRMREDIFGWKAWVPFGGTRRKFERVRWNVANALHRAALSNDPSLAGMDRVMYGEIANTLDQINAQDVLRDKQRWSQRAWSLLWRRSGQRGRS